MKNLLKKLFEFISIILAIVITILVIKNYSLDILKWFLFKNIYLSFLLIICLITLIVKLISFPLFFILRIVLGDNAEKTINPKLNKYTVHKEQEETHWWKYLSTSLKNINPNKFYVEPHRRKDGTYVKGHWRRKPK